MGPGRSWLVCLISRSPGDRGHLREKEGNGVQEVTSAPGAPPGGHKGSWSPQIPWGVGLGEPQRLDPSGLPPAWCELLGAVGAPPLCYRRHIQPRALQAPSVTADQANGPATPSAVLAPVPGPPGGCQSGHTGVSSLGSGVDVDTKDISAGGTVLRFRN